LAKVKLREGRFYSFCTRAAKDPSNTYVFIIDEINRGNLSKIFGELMLLIEADKRGPRWSIPLAYAETEEEQFFVPENVYVLGLMNTADRSLSLVDYALRRRFAFFSLDSMIETPSFAGFLLERGVPEELVSHIQNRLGALNEFIADKAHSGLGSGFCVGHSYFVPGDESQSSDTSWYNQIIQTQIVPLLEEYWFDNDELVSEWRSKLSVGV
jgi:5-methylcytosine-specific restriction protein B